MNTLTLNHRDTEAQRPNGALAGLRLKEREVRAWRGVAEGKQRKELCDELGTCTHALENWLAKVRDRVGARNAADLTRAAVAYGVITVEVRR